MEGMPARAGLGHDRGSQVDRPGLAAIIDALVMALRHERFEDLRHQFEGVSARAMGWREVRLTSRSAGHAGGALLRECSTWDLPVPGSPVVVQCDPGPTEGVHRDEELALGPLASLAALTLELERLQAGLSRPNKRSGNWQLVGSSRAMESVRQRVLQVARTSFPVLVEGESGVGKEVVARLVHQHSRRARGPFVAVNCAAIVDTLLEAELFGIEDRTATGVRGRRGRFEVADGGTLFLDEIGDLSPAAQAKLLRVLQDFTIERVGAHVAVPVNVRVVAATNRGLAEMVAQRRFRPDLFYRLNGVEIVVPPLRERPEDVPELIEHVLSRHREYGIIGLTPEALSALELYRWPGNVRELERVVERAITLSNGEMVDVEHLPAPVAAPFLDAFGGPVRSESSLRQFASHYVRLMLHRSGGNKREACRLLGISYHTLEGHLRRAAASGTLSRLGAQGRSAPDPAAGLP